MEEDLANRLENWVQRLGKDKSLPWVGLGLIDDLTAAVEVLRSGPAKSDPRQTALEFDL